MNTRKIGRIISVDSFRIIVELDNDLKSLYKSGFQDIYEIAKINSYIIVTIGADRIVAIVTRVKIQDETELERLQGSITLPKAKRYLVATMIGTIQKKGEKTSYIQGVYNYPVLDNPVWYIIKEDLDRIFDTKVETREEEGKEDNSINFEEDYFLPIGTSPVFNGYQIKINPDKFFGKHAAILGNTGSGKSCTLSSIIQSLFKFQYSYKNEKTSTIEKRNLKNAHFIIFDTNGEYKKAFGIDNKEHNIINSFYIDKEGIKVPYWFMNFEDFDYLFEPSAGTQVPLLKNSIGLAKERNIKTNNNIDSYIEKGINNILYASPEEIKKMKCHNNFGNWEWYENNTIKQLSDAIISSEDSNVINIKQLLKTLASNVDINTENKTIINLKEKFNNYLDSGNMKKITLQKNIDTPIYFSFEKLLTKHFDEAIEQSEDSASKLREYASTLKLRIQSYFNDERIASPLLLKHKDKIENGLAKFMAFILGDFYKIFNEQDDDIFSKYYNKDNNILKDKTNQITIIDMSLLSYEVLETITGLIGRLILDFASRIEDRGKFPLVLVLEEAQNYIPEINRKDRVSISKKVFERIAREGRKYGISLVVSSQRPSELSKTVLSQCNSFLIHRLQNPDDQKYIRQLVSAANEDILSQLPILPQQHAIVMGDAVRTPVQVKINDAKPKPNSDNPKFIERWLQEYPKTVPDYISIAKKWEETKSNSIDDKKE